MVMARTSAIACGHKDAIDLDRLRHDPLMKVAVGRHPQTGAPLASQSTISRLRMRRARSEAARLGVALLDQFGVTVEAGPALRSSTSTTRSVPRMAASSWRSGTRITTNAASRRCTSITWRAARRSPPSCARRAPEGHGGEDRSSSHRDEASEAALASHPYRVARRWSFTAASKPWNGLENDGDDYIFGLAGNAVLDAMVAKTADNLRFHHAKSRQPKLRTYASFMYQAGSWKRPRKVVSQARMLAAAGCRRKPPRTGLRQEVDIRYVVTSLKGSAQYLYKDVYCQRGQMENLIKLHKAQLASDACRVTARRPIRCGLPSIPPHSGLMHGVRAAIPQTDPLAKAEFATIRERLIKIGRALIEHLARIRIQLPTSCRRRAVPHRRARHHAVRAVSGGRCAPPNPPTTADQPKNALHSEVGPPPISQSERWRAPPQLRCKNAPRGA